MGNCILVIKRFPFCIGKVISMDILPITFKKMLDFRFNMIKWFDKICIALQFSKIKLFITFCVTEMFLLLNWVHLKLQFCQTINLVNI